MFRRYTSHFFNFYMKGKHADPQGNLVDRRGRGMALTHNTQAYKAWLAALRISILGELQIMRFNPMTSNLEGHLNATHAKSSWHEIHFTCYIHKASKFGSKLPTLIPPPRGKKNFQSMLLDTHSSFFHAPFSNLKSNNSEAFLI